MKLPFFKKADVILLAVLLVIGAACMVLLRGSSDPGSVAVVRVDGEEVARLPLDKDAELHVENNGYHLTVAVENGAVFVREADCPDRVCQHTGKISKRGTSIVCVPAGVTVIIGKGGSDDADFVAG